MSKILIISNSDQGLYSFRKELIQELSDKKYEVYLVMPYGERVEYFKEMGIKFVETNLNRRGTNPFSDFKLYKQYKKIMKDIKPDIVLTYTIKPNIYGGMVAKKLKIPYIANITGLGTAVENKGLLQKITTFLYKRAFKKINTVFFQNEENMKYFEVNKIAIGKHELLPGSGVNINHYKLLEYPKDNIIRFVFVSRIMKEKGIDYYLEAATYFKNKYDNIEFHICGFLEEDYKQVIDNAVKENIVIYHGLVDDIREVFKDMHAIIHPTYYPEGMSNVLLEAAATGRPGIASNRSGCREIIDHSTTGYLFEPHNVEELISKIEEFIKLSNEDKKNMGISARNKVVNEFNRDIVVNEYMNKIKRI